MGVVSNFYKNYLQDVNRFREMTCGSKWVWLLEIWGVAFEGVVSELIRLFFLLWGIGNGEWLAVSGSDSCMSGEWLLAYNWLLDSWE